MSAAITRPIPASNATTAKIIGFIGTLRLADDRPGPQPLYGVQRAAPSPHARTPATILFWRLGPGRMVPLPPLSSRTSLLLLFFARFWLAAITVTAVRLVAGIDRARPRM